MRVSPYVNERFGPRPGRPHPFSTRADVQRLLHTQDLGWRAKYRAELDRKKARQTKVGQSIVLHTADLLWPGAKKLLGAKGKRPKFYFDKKESPDAGAYVKSNSKDRVHIPPPTARLSARFDPKWMARTLLHEWAHTRQKSFKDKTLTEGGAESFERYATKKLVGKVPSIRKSYTSPQQKDYLRMMREARKKGPDYIRKGQFK